MKHSGGGEIATMVGYSYSLASGEVEEKFTNLLF